MEANFFFFFFKVCCKESLWKRSELSENCFHSVVKIILINYAKKNQLIHAWDGVKAQNG
jgi:hypothetical protein